MKTYYARIIECKTTNDKYYDRVGIFFVTHHVNRIYVAPYYIQIVNCIPCTYLVNSETS
jgi:hypothetical protein